VGAQRSTSDSRLIRDSLAQPAAFAEIFERHFETVHRYVSRRVRDHAADDLASDVFTVAFDRRGTFRDESDSALPWLLGIATHLLHNHGRAERSAWNLNHRLQEAFSGEPTDGAADDVVTAERGERLAGALAGLSPEQRDVVLLFAWADLSYEQIAEALAVPLGTVRSRLSRARSELRVGLADTITISREENP
jgi:RNA polymerase sigma factor (sigma-70 family)